ncbi:MAG: Xaa-Pro peptidase family protein [Bryobacterales bacterium]|nr:Xaa-Pro peptidase family protein [Bryobacteraceae bacterium]MDW8353573.1 Xaa-Pro peptidase family protein [Bryobacterales bacterium]
MPTEFAQRRRRLASQLAERRLEALLVCSAPNIRYLSGFTGSNALLVVTGDTAQLFTDPRYRLQARSESDCGVTVARGPLLVAAARWIRRHRLRRVGFDPAHLPYSLFEQLDKELPERTRLTPAPGLVEGLRLVKSAEELARIRRSVETNSRAFAATLSLIRPGLRECELAAELEYQARKLGAERPAFDTIVASGPRSAHPHARPTANCLERNHLLLIDMGAVQDGYTSDMTRTLYLGRPGQRVRDVYRAVLEAQEAAIGAVRPGATAEGVDRAARLCLRKAGLARAFVHSTGHGLGLEVHEKPRLGKGDSTRLEAGMALTIEPGVYFEEFGGIRIEDTVVVTPHGCEVLTPTPKELIVI